MKSICKNGLTLLLCLIMIFSSVGCSSSDKQSTDNQETSDVTEMKREFKQAENFKSAGKYLNWDVAYEDSASQLLVDTASATVAVLDKASGHLWKSNLTQQEIDANGTLSPTVINDALSQFTISYYDSRNAKVTYGSYEYAMKDEKYEINNIQNGISVQYNIGKNADDFYFPIVLRESTYNELIAKMTKEQADKFAGYYKFYNYNTMDDAVKLSLSTTYPIVKKENIYVTTISAKLVKTRFVKSVLFDIGVNLEFIENEYKAVGYGYNVPDAPNFDVTINYTITNGKLNVKIPDGGVVYNSKAYILNSITLLPYFGAEINVDNGYMFVPDGSGALIDVNTEQSSIFSLPFYGYDYTLRTKDYAENMQQATLPVFGVINNKDAFIAHVTDGATIGSVSAYLKYPVFPIARICSTFELHDFEQYMSQGQTSASTLVKYAKKSYKGDISIDFYFLTGDKANYVGMASKMRDVLFGGTKKVDETTPRFYLETYGAVIRKKYLLGYPLSVLKPLTTVEQATEIYNSVRNSGINNIAVRYNNWSVDKYRNDINKIGSLMSQVGTKTEWKEFQNYVNGLGNTLYANVDPVLDEDTGSVFDAPWHSKQIDGTLVNYGDTGDIYSRGVTDSLYLTVIKNSEAVKKISDVLKKLDKLEISAVSYDTLGKYIFSDFNEKSEEMRNKVVDGYKQILQQTKDDGKDIMVTAGNSYTYNYARDIVELPMGTSRDYYEKQVPFIQIVLHGYVSYAGEAINLSDNTEIEYLKAVEYGSGLRYVLNYAEPKTIKDTNYSYLYSTQWSNWIDDAKSRYTRLESVLGGTQSSVIVGHQEVQSNVFVTTYENGVYVIVNYNDYSISYNGISVGAKDFASGKNK